MEWREECFAKGTSCVFLAQCKTMQPEAGRTGRRFLNERCTFTAASGNPLSAYSTLSATFQATAGTYQEKNVGMNI
eukprot:3275123-Amphidinium_carterae.1